MKHLLAEGLVEVARETHNERLTEYVPSPAGRALLAEEKRDA
ncbi:hypothetical protein [Aureimonas ureilytica]|nr:hypothetical protein [Aureimonas ureilytica]